ncbi:nuclease-related domain-containing protein [Nocardiopsis sp. MG754419]|uniref:nuclease-related domain-containing protein n=1 Tax=Nocardiopsis sp. MG754419 TaxID=2259865 RepID=UPI0027DE4FBE|nr:nuclease-related domain-containing protein [Nocardiopsis sp. MG754419]MBR8744863.1 NERD domain-containing protein [Nocardiopsis sp. MG754419]
MNGSGSTSGGSGSESPEALFFPNQRKTDGIDGKALYGALKSNDALRRWIVRSLVAGIVAGGIGMLTGEWRVGVSFGLIALVSVMVWSSRRESEIPRWRKPSAAQRRTEAQLKVMKQLGYRVLHARAVPGGNGQIDHFIVGRRGAFAIDSESWDKRLPLRNKLEKLYHGRFSKNERIDEALEEAERAAELISEELGRDIKVRASLAIYGPGMPWDSHRLRGVDIITGTKVRKWLRTGRDRLSETEIEEIHKAAEKALPPRY